MGKFEVSIFDMRLRDGGYDDAYSALVDAHATTEAYHKRLSEEDFLASPEGFARTVASPDFVVAVEKAAKARDARLAREAEDYRRHVAAITQRFHESIANEHARHRKMVQGAHEHFEGEQRGHLQRIGRLVMRGWNPRPDERWGEWLRPHYFTGYRAGFVGGDAKPPRQEVEASYYEAGYNDGNLDRKGAGA